MLTNLKHANREAWLLLIALSASLVFDMADPLVLILTVNGALVHRVALITGMPDIVALSFGVSSALILPFLFMQLIDPTIVRRDSVIRLALVGLAMGGINWMFLAYSAQALDCPTVTIIFARNGIWNILLAGILAYRLNYQQQRRRETPPCTSA